MLRGPFSSLLPAAASGGVGGLKPSKDDESVAVSEALESNGLSLPLSL